MQLFCTQCEAAFSGTTHCPRCAMRLISPQELYVAAETAAPPPDVIAPSFLGRVVVGVLTAVGLVFAFRELATAIAPGELVDPWLGFALRILAMVGGGLLAGATRPNGAQTGALVGLITGGLIVAADSTANSDLHHWWMSGLAVAFPLVAAVAGWFGAYIWPPLSDWSALLKGSKIASSIRKLGLSGMAEESALRNAGRPTSWIRIVIGSMIGFLGVLASDEIRTILGYGSGGILQTTGVARGPSVGVQLAALMLFFGGIIAGSNTGAGLRHGFLAGLLTTLDLLVASIGRGEKPYPAVEGFFQLLNMNPGPLTDPEIGAAVTLAVFTLATAGGWLGGQLLLPLARAKQFARRRYE